MSVRKHQPVVAGMLRMDRWYLRSTACNQSISLSYKFLYKKYTPITRATVTKDAHLN